VSPGKSFVDRSLLKVREGVKESKGEVSVPFLLTKLGYFI
jgi:hypothetical protein